MGNTITYQDKSKEELIEELEKMQQELNSLKSSTDTPSAANNTGESTASSEIRYRRLFETAKDGIIILDAETGKILDVNPYLINLVGTSKDQFIGRSIFELHIFRHIFHNTKYFSELQKNGYLRLDDLPLETINDKNIGVELVCNVYFENTERVIQCNIRDISERKKTELELIRAKEHAEESDRLKTAFLHNMSHEIRTPMNAIMGFAELLVRNYNNKPKLEKFAKIIQSRCNDLLDIVNDILDIAKIEAGQLPVNNEEINLNDIFAELNTFFTEYQERIEKQHISFSIRNLCNSNDNIIITDRVKLKQIFFNLISNAYKFTDEGNIECGCRYDQNHYRIFYVKDTGIGIPSDKHDYIFNRFTRLTQNSQKIISGTGLGLSIVKGLVSLLGGQVFVASEPGKGSTFSFTIDNKIPMPAPAGSNSNSTDIPVVKNISHKTILIVEDDNYNAEYIKEILSDTGVNIMVAENGKEAIERSINQDIDLVLMDIQLPDIDGYEISRQIHKHKPELKILAQSAYASFDDKQKAREAGFTDYITKPIKHEVLLSIIDKHLLST